MNNFRNVPEGLRLSNKSYVELLSKRSFTQPPRRHQQPEHLSWQWSVKKDPELTKCTNLCLPKVCPKKSFFPRLKKSYIPAEKKSCTPPKKTETWKEYFSFLLPDPVPLPPLITCRKLQARRRRCCESPYDCPGYCLNDNCCPPPKEWFGQAVIHCVPSGFPEPALQDEPRPCAPPTLQEPSFKEETCPKPKEKELDMEEYAYVKVFSGIKACEETKSAESFKCKNVCPKKSLEPLKTNKLSCGFYPSLREGSCPELVQSTDPRDVLPRKICDGKTEPESPPEKDIIVEEKKGECARTSFLKPFKYGEKFPGMSSAREYHTFMKSKSLNSLPGSVAERMFSTGESRSGRVPVVQDPNPASILKSKWLNQEAPAFINRMTYYQPSKSGTGIQSILTKAMSGHWKHDGFYTPPENYYQRDKKSYDELSSYYGVPGIDPQLLSFAEETKKKFKHPASGSEDKPAPVVNSLARKLSEEVNKKEIIKAKEKGEMSPMVEKSLAIGRSKLSLLRKANSEMNLSRANFMTDCTTYARKKDNKEKNKQKIICSGCSGIRMAEEEECNPTPKSFLDCKVRPAGKCRGPTRKLEPGEPEPQNPYYKNRAKPYSLCNKARPIVKKQERPHKLPCEDQNKRKYHTSTARKTSAPVFTPLYDIMKTKGFPKDAKVSAASNAWDSHTSESYVEKEKDTYDSVPDLSKFNNNELNKNTAKILPFGFSGRVSKSTAPKTVDEWDRPMKESSDASSLSCPAFNTNERFSNLTFMANEKTVSMAESTEQPLPNENSGNRKRTSKRISSCALNIWDSPKNGKGENENVLGKQESSPNIIPNKHFHTQNLTQEERKPICWPITTSQNLSRLDDKPTRFSVLFKSTVKKPKQKGREDFQEGNDRKMNFF